MRRALAMTSRSASARHRFRRPRGAPVVTALAAAALAVPALSGAVLLAPAASAQASPTPLAPARPVR
jgi:hypothetical protein